MRIEALRVEGYGVFQGLELGPLGQLVVILGPNESGKTTLLSFVRAMLFGFPDRHSNENRYEPWSGGRHGGSLTLVDGDGRRFRIERFAGPSGGPLSVTLADGAGEQRETAETLLGDASREVFRTIFAFGPDELQDFGTLTRDEVKGRIYGVSLGAGRLPVDEADAALARVQAQLLAPRGEGTVNRLLKEMELAQASLDRDGSRAAQHATLVGQMEQLEREIGQRRREHLDKQEQLRHVRGLLDVWDDYLEYRAATGELRSLPDLVNFPAGAVARLEALAGRRRAKCEDLETVQSDLRRCVEELGSLKTDGRLVALAPDLDRLRQGLGRYESAKNDLPGIEEHLRLALRDFDEVLLELGPGWDAGRLANFEAPASAREEVRAQRASLSEARQALRDAENNLLNRCEVARSVQSQHNRARSRLDSIQAPAEVDSAVLDERRRKARRFYESVVEQNETLAKLKGLEERSNELLTTLSSSRHLETEGPEFQPLLPLLALSIMMAAVGVALVVLDQYAAGAAVGILFLVPVGLSIFIWYSYPRPFRQQRSSVREHIRSAAGRLEAIEAERDAVEGDLERRRLVIEGLQDDLGFAAAAALPEVQALESELEAQSGALVEWRLQNAVAEGLAGQASEAAEQEATSEAERARKAKELARVSHEWTSLLNSLGLPGEITPDGCQEWLSTLDVARERLRAVEELSARARSLRAEVETFEADARRLLVPGEHPGQEGEALRALVERLGAAVAQAVRAEQHAARLQASITEVEERAEVLQEGLEATNGQVEQLLLETGAGDEEELRARAAAFETRERLLSTVNDRARSLERLAGSGQHLDDVLRELEGTTLRDLREAHSQVGQEAADLDSSIMALDRADGHLQRQILELEAEDEATGLRFESLMLRQQLEASAGEWCVAAISRKLIRETREFCERERQPAVIQEAQAFFVRMTGGRYRRLVSPFGEQRLSVEDASGRIKDLPHLSRGTSEQLYLALRFGLVREFGRRSEPLPVLMDDVLSNFDRQRAEQACAAIAELSVTHQVILFTCHTSTAELLRSAADQFQLVQLADSIPGAALRSVRPTEERQGASPSRASRQPPRPSPASLV